MAEIDIPKLDPRDEERVVVDVLDRLPPELSDRSAGAVVVKLTEAMGALYGALLFQMNRWPQAFQIAILKLLRIERMDAQPAHVVLTFSRASTGGNVTIPAGTIVKTGSGSSDIRFVTDRDARIRDGALSVLVDATAETPGAHGNVTAGTLETFDAPIAGVDAVTNHDAAQEGSDVETQNEWLERSPTVIRSTDGKRAITRADFEAVALLYGDIQRASVRNFTRRGWIDIDVLNSDWNDALDEPALTAVEAFVLHRTVLGVRVRVYAAPVVKLQILSIMGVLNPGADKEQVAQVLEDRVLQWMNPYEPTTLPNEQVDIWQFGRAIYENNLVALCADLPELERLDRVRVQYTIDQQVDTWDFENNNHLTLPEHSVIRPVRDDVPPAFIEATP